MAALLSEATLNIPETRSITMLSKGTVLVLGDGQSALGAAAKLADRMDVTVVLGGAREAIAPSPNHLTSIRRGRGNDRDDCAGWWWAARQRAALRRQ